MTNAYSKQVVRPEESRRKSLGLLLASVRRRRRGKKGYNGLLKSSEDEGARVIFDETGEILGVCPSSAFAVEPTDAPTLSTDGGHDQVDEDEEAREILADASRTNSLGVLLASVGRRTRGHKGCNCNGLPKSSEGEGARVIFDESGEILGVCPGSAFTPEPTDAPTLSTDGSGRDQLDERARLLFADIGENVGRAEERIRRQTRDVDSTASADSDDWLTLVTTVAHVCKSSECSTRSTDSMSRDDPMSIDDDASMPTLNSKSHVESRDVPSRTSPMQVSVRKMERSNENQASKGYLEDGHEAMPVMGVDLIDYCDVPAEQSKNDKRDDEFWLAVSKMRGVRETRPLGGPKYYVVSITNMGEARIVHEAMPVMDASFLRAAVCEERGFEIIEYDLLAEGLRDEKGGYFMCGVGEFLNPNYSTKNDDSSRCASPTVAKVRTEVAEPEPIDWTNNDVFLLRGGQEDVSVISDCTYGSVESEPTFLSMDSWLTGGSEDNTEAWSRGDALGFTLYDCCHPVAFD